VFLFSIVARVSFVAFPLHFPRHICFIFHLSPVIDYRFHSFYLCIKFIYGAFFFAISVGFISAARSHFVNHTYMEKSGWKIGLGVAQLWGELVDACLFGECLIGLNYTHPQAQTEFSAKVQNVRVRRCEIKIKLELRAREINIFNCLLLTDYTFNNKNK